MKLCVRTRRLMVLDDVTVGLRFSGDHRRGRAGQSATCIFGTELECDRVLDGHAGRGDTDLCDLVGDLFNSRMRLGLSFLENVLRKESTERLGTERDLVVPSSIGWLLR